jgi:hypothetical protein
MSQDHFNTIVHIIRNRLSPFFIYKEEQSLLLSLTDDKIFGEQLGDYIFGLFTYLFNLWRAYSDLHKDYSELIANTGLISDSLHTIRRILTGDLDAGAIRLLEVLPLERLDDLIADTDDVYMIIRMPWNELRHYPNNQSLQETIYYRLSPNTRKRMSAYKPIRRPRLNCG